MSKIEHTIRDCDEEVRRRATRNGQWITCSCGRRCHRVDFMTIEFQVPGVKPLTGRALEEDIAAEEHALNLEYEAGGPLTPSEGREIDEANWHYPMDAVLEYP